MRKIVFIFFLLWGSLSVKAQVPDLFDDLLQSKIKLEVKQLGEFFDRFNMKDTVPGVNGLQPTRFTNILSLFNMQNQNFKNDSSVFHFASDVITSGKGLSYKDTNWYAIANSVFSYNGVKREIPLTLKYMKNSGQGYSWILVGVELSRLGTTLNRSDDKDIGPLNNELAFLDLSKAFDKKSDIASFTAEGFRPDYMSIFLYLVESGIIKFIQMDSISYHFLNVNGWIFKVEDFNRMDFNSGWLIASMLKANTEAKNYYKKSILQLQ